MKLHERSDLRSDEFEIAPQRAAGGDVQGKPARWAPGGVRSVIVGCVLIVIGYALGNELVTPPPDSGSSRYTFVNSAGVVATWSWDQESRPLETDAVIRIGETLAIAADALEGWECRWPTKADGPPPDGLSPTVAVICESHECIRDACATTTVWIPGS